MKSQDRPKDDCFASALRLLNKASKMRALKEEFADYKDEQEEKKVKGRISRSTEEETDGPPKGD